MTKRSLFIVLAIWLAGSAACRDKEQAAKNAATASNGVAAESRAPQENSRPASQGSTADPQQDDSELVQDIK